MIDQLDHLSTEAIRIFFTLYEPHKFWFLQQIVTYPFWRNKTKYIIVKGEYWTIKIRNVPIPILVLIQKRTFGVFVAVTTLCFSGQIFDEILYKY